MRVGIHGPSFIVIILTAPYRTLEQGIERKLWSVFGSKRKGCITVLYLAQDEKWQVTVTVMDLQLAEERKSKGCPYCGGKLHSARFPRLLRGETGNTPASTHRHSFCCATCRKRVTPPSVRFFGRRRYAMTSMLLISVLQPGKANKAQHDKLRSLLGISKRTLARWRLWWREALVRTPLWKAEGACILPPVPRQGLPGTLIERFTGNSVQQLLRALVFLSPLSAPRFFLDKRGP